MEEQKIPIIVTEDTLKFKKGQILESYKIVQDGVEIKSDYLNETKFVFLTEKLSDEDEKKIKELIQTQIKKLLWNLYTKSNVLI